MAIREGKWRCPYCGNVNRGAEPACKGCGATRDKDIAFFLDDDAPEVSDEALLEKARAGAEWLCLFCQTGNPPAATQCRNCGAEKGAAPSRPVRELPLAPPPPSAPPSPLRSTGGSGFRLGCAVALLLVLGLCGTATFLSLRKTDERVTVSGFEWERQIEIEAYRTIRDAAWEGEAPAGARVVSRSRELHHTEREQIGTRRVKTGTRDLGNGFFEDVYTNEPVYRDRPVYRTRVRYDVERWVHERTLRTSGNDQSPRWPAAPVASSEREGPRRETYAVLLSGRKSYRMSLPLARWQSLEEGQTFDAVIQGGSRVLELR